MKTKLEMILFISKLFISYFLLVSAKSCLSQYTEVNTDGCAFPFTYNGLTFHKCISMDRKHPWCSLTSEYRGVWKYCQDMTKPVLKCTKECALNNLPYLNCMTNVRKIMYCIDQILDLEANHSAHCPLLYHRISSFHTVCLPPSVHVAKSGVSLEDKHLIVNTHNFWRINVSVPAANMQKIYWDETLAMIAQKHADRCSFTHDDPELRSVPGTGTFPGQNIAMTTGPRFYSWDNALGTMFSGEKVRWKYDVGILKEYYGRNALHYTQAIMADVSKVGCGYSECVYPDRIEKFYVCNYNKLQTLETTVRPYKKGKKFCEDCLNTCSEEKLCDCKGKICNNGGSLDLNTCTCTCKGFWTGRNCVKPIIPKLMPNGCYFPFFYDGELQYKCVYDEDSKSSWCSTTPSFQGEVEWCDEVSTEQFPTTEHQTIESDLESQ